MSPLTGGSKPKHGADAGKALARQMAHFSPKVIQTKRRMAHPVRKGVLASVRNGFTGLLPIDNASAPTRGYIDSSGQHSTTGPRLREIPVVLALLGYPGPQLLRSGSIHSVQLRRNALGLADAAAHYSRRSIVELAQVRQRLGIARIQPDRFFKLGPHSLAQRIGAHERSPVGLLAQRPAQP